LTNAQKQKIHEQIDKLGDKEKLTEDEAKAQLDAILDVVKDQREMLEAAGYRWPGSGGGPGGGGPGGGGPGGGRPPAPDANPFRDGDNAVHLKALQKQVGKAPPG
jgi:hypothetical protein